MKGFLKLVLLSCLLTGLAVPSQAQVLGDLVDTFVPFDSNEPVVAGKRATVVYSTFFDPLTINGAAVEIGTLDPDPAIEFRFSGKDGWSEWSNAVQVPSATGGTIVAGVRSSSEFGARSLEVRVSTSLDLPVEFRNGGLFRNSTDTDRLPAPDMSPVLGNKTGDIIPPHLITRAEWNAKPFQLGSPVPLASPSYDFMTWHHAAGYSAETLDEGKAQMRAMQALHQDIRGWSDIGYQFAIDRSGRLYQGRPFMDNSTSLSQVPVLARGAHVGGANTGNIGVVIMGCYHPPEGSYCEQEITPAAYNTYVTLFAFLSERYGVSPSFIRGHRDFSSTSCPGDNNYALIPGLRTDVAALIETGNQPLGEATMTAEVSSGNEVNLAWSVEQDFGIESLVLERKTGLEISTVVDDAVSTTNWTDASLAGVSEVTYLLIASHSDGRRQELARIELDVPAPSSYVLTTAFPNPASTSTSFKYYLSIEGIPTVTLYDAMGREIEAWSPGFQDADTWYSLSADVSGLASGMYFFRIQVQGFSNVVFDKTHGFSVTR